LFREIQVQRFNFFVRGSLSRAVAFDGFTPLWPKTPSIWPLKIFEDELRRILVRERGRNSFFVRPDGPAATAKATAG